MHHIILLSNSRHHVGLELYQHLGRCSALACAVTSLPSLCYRSRRNTWCAPDCLQPLLHVQSSNFTTKIVGASQGSSSKIVGAKEVYLHFKMRALVALAGVAVPQQRVPWSDTSFLCWAATHSNAQITADSFCSLCSCHFTSKALHMQKEHVNTCILILFLERGAAFDSDPGQLHPAYLRLSICRRRDPLVWFAQVLQRFLLSWIQTTISWNIWEYNHP